jgi:116 kDa U5 small nuclear ribonucleoprotein component N-terminus
MDESLYDEFGNYIGPELPDSEDDSEESEEEEEDDIEPEDVTALVSMFALQRFPVHTCSAMRANQPVHSVDQDPLHRSKAYGFANTN